MTDSFKPTDNSISREELEALKDLLDKNLMKYRNYNEYSVKKRPNDPYIGQILQNLNEGYQSNSNDNYNSKKISQKQSQNYQMPIRRKIIRHTVISTPIGNRFNGNSMVQGVGGNQLNMNRVYGNNDIESRIEWSSPWADYFPILIKDPFQTMMNSFSEIIEYGPAADICRHAGDGAEDEDRMNSERKTGHESDDTTLGQKFRPETLKRSRRNTGGEEEKGVLNHARPFKPHHHAPTTTTEQSKLYMPWGPDKQASEHNGDTGPQIKRLIVRKGGVAIAGPGGIATAGSGGTAIVGPGGSAYSSKDTASGATADVPIMPAGGYSNAGYGPQVVQGPLGYFSPYAQQHHNYGRSVDSDRNSGGTALLSSDGVSYSFPVPSRGLTAVTSAATDQHRSDNDVDGGPVTPYVASTAREIRLPDGAKLIATGPIVYYNPEPLSKAVARKKSRKGRKSSSRVQARNLNNNNSNQPL